MRISTQDWKRYINRLAQINTKASSLMSEWVAKNGFSDTEALISYAHALATKYGEGSAELACQMYDAIAEMEGASVMAAVPAPTATYQETAKAINGSLLRSDSGQLLESTVARLVKQPAADTMLQNARRDGAQFAWIPSGDTCPFCITLASRGWQYQSKNANKNGHAEHIHANCDCQYAIRFNSNTNIEGYDPDALLEQYNSFTGSPKDKINAMRRENYAANKDKINAQKREAYAKRKNVLTDKQKGFILKLEDSPKMIGETSPSELKTHLEELGFETKPLSRGSLKDIPFKDGGGYKINYSGDGYIQFHPETNSHHEGAYYKLSSAKNGTKRYNMEGDEIL